MSENSCVCQTCKNACAFRPGSFMPEQLPALLEHFGVDNIRELVNTGDVAIDWCNDDEGEDQLILSANIVYNDDSIQYPADPRARCKHFTVDDKCAIYEVRPFDCSEYSHDETKKATLARHAEVATAWRDSGLLDEFSDEVEMEGLCYVGYDGGLLGGIFSY